jgi:hypothetical protein
MGDDFITLLMDVISNSSYRPLTDDSMNSSELLNVYKWISGVIMSSETSCAEDYG